MSTLHEELSGLQPVELDAGLVFGGKASGTLVQGYADATALTPSIDPHFRFPEASRDVIVWFISPEDPLYLFGPTGCGKSSCIRQLAARLRGDRTWPSGICRSGRAPEPEGRQYDL